MANYIKSLAVAATTTLAAMAGFVPAKAQDKPASVVESWADANTMLPKQEFVDPRLLSATEALEQNFKQLSPEDQAYFRNYVLEFGDLNDPQSQRVQELKNYYEKVWVYNQGGLAEQAGLDFKSLVNPPKPGAAALEKLLGSLVKNGYTVANDPNQFYFSETGGVFIIDGSAVKTGKCVNNEQEKTCKILLPFSGAEDYAYRLKDFMTKFNANGGVTTQLIDGTKDNAPAAIKGQKFKICQFSNPHSADMDLSGENLPEGPARELITNHNIYKNVVNCFKPQQ